VAFGPWRLARSAEQEKATRPDQRWSTDLMYVQVGTGTYFFVSFMDEYARYIVHHEVLPDMGGVSVSLAAQRAIATLPKGADGLPVGPRLGLRGIALQDSPQHLFGAGHVVAFLEQCVGQVDPRRHVPRLASNGCFEKLPGRTEFLAR
jgi:transposase InsO family protein